MFEFQIFRLKKTVHWNTNFFTEDSFEIHLGCWKYEEKTTTQLYFPFLLITTLSDIEKERDFCYCRIVWQSTWKAIFIHSLTKLAYNFICGKYRPTPTVYDTIILTTEDNSVKRPRAKLPLWKTKRKKSWKAAEITERKTLRKAAEYECANSHRKITFQNAESTSTTKRQDLPNILNNNETMKPNIRWSRAKWIIGLNVLKSHTCQTKE
jgi:hypothetical protein